MRTDWVAGATIIVTYTSKDATDAVKPISEKYGVPIHVYRCPGEESKVVDEVVEKASKEVGEIDVVVVNAGESGRSSVTPIARADIQVFLCGKTISIALTVRLLPLQKGTKA